IRPFMEEIGWSVRNVINVDNYSFDQEAFLTAASEAIDGRDATILAENLSWEVVFKPARSKEHRTFTINDAESDVSIPINLPNMLLLKKSITERESLLKSNPMWFDLPQERLDQLIAEIVVTESDIERISRLEEAQKNSASLFYLNLYREIDRRQQFKISELFPDDKTILLKHIRVHFDTESSPTDYTNILNESARTLVTEEGIREAIDRLGGLPISLPEPIISHITGMHITDRKILMKDLMKMAGSPISLFHLMHILQHFSKEDPPYNRLIN
ncbi:unnamed protein product, partial [marine sediment metagenome]